MSDAHGASRPPPPEVPAVVHDGVRYEQDRVDAAGGDQNGGFLAAVDEATGARLWRLQVYEVPGGGPDAPTMGLYFRSMRILPGGDALEIENEAGGRYRVDLQARRSTRIEPSTPETAPPSPPRPKPQPE